MYNNNWIKEFFIIFNNQYFKFYVFTLHMNECIGLHKQIFLKIYTFSLIFHNSFPYIIRNYCLRYVFTDHKMIISDAFSALICH